MCNWSGKRYVQNLWSFAHSAHIHTTRAGLFCEVCQKIKVSQSTDGIGVLALCTNVLHEVQLHISHTEV